MRRELGEKKSVGAGELWRRKDITLTQMATTAAVNNTSAAAAVPHARTNQDKIKLLHENLKLRLVALDATHFQLLNHLHKQLDESVDELTAKGKSTGNDRHHTGSGGADS